MIFFVNFCFFLSLRWYRSVVLRSPVLHLEVIRSIIPKKFTYFLLPFNKREYEEYGLKRGSSSILKQV